MENQSNEARAGQADPVCPQCGRGEDVAEAVQLQRSFSTGAFLLGGWLGVFLWGAGRPRRMHCRACQVTFEVATQSSKAFRVAAFVVLLLGAAVAVSAALRV
jgi:hypothetical protein